MTNVTFIGVGNMGGAILAGLVASGHPTASITAGVRRTEHGEELVERYGIRAAPSHLSAQGADVVILGVKPYQVVELLDSLELTAGQIVVSLAAGITTETLSAHVPAGVEVVRVMPNTPSTIREGMSLVTGGEATSEHALAVAEGLLGAVGPTVRLPERLFNAGTALSGSGPAYLFYVAEALIAAGVELGLDHAVADHLVRQTLAGSALLLRQSPESPETLRANVTSPNGTTHAAVQVFEAAEMRTTFLEAARANVHRSLEIAAGR